MLDKSLTSDGRPISYEAGVVYYTTISHHTGRLIGKFFTKGLSEDNVIDISDHGLFVPKK